MKKVLLVVDDELIVSNVLTVQFGQDEIEIVSAKNGEDGLRMAFSNHPDLILLDIVMPKMDGINMLNKLREDEWGRNAKVIVLSNLDDIDTIKEAEGRGVSEYLVKANLSAIDLAGKIRKMLGI